MGQLLVFAVGKYKAVQLSIERRSFELSSKGSSGRLSPINLSGCHPGHPVRLLRQQADELCANFARRWNITPDLLEAQIPAIRKLKSLADPSPKPEPAILVSLGVVAAVALFFLMGVLAGLASVGYHLIGGR